MYNKILRATFWMFTSSSNGCIIFLRKKLCVAVILFYMMHLIPASSFRIPEQQHYQRRTSSSSCLKIIQMNDMQTNVCLYSIDHTNMFVYFCSVNHSTHFNNFIKQGQRVIKLSHLYIYTHTQCSSPTFYINLDTCDRRKYKCISSAECHIFS